MRIGLNVISMHAADLVSGAALAEELGYDSVWYGEHVLLPRGTKYPVISLVAFDEARNDGQPERGHEVPLRRIAAG